MGGVEDNQWFDKFMDEIGLVFTKVDETIQKSIELWKELTRDIIDDQPTQNLTGQPNSCEENSSQYPVAEVKERPIKHWSMCLDEVEEKQSQHWALCLAEVKEKPSQHWAMRASKIPESFIQEQGYDDYYDDDADGDDDIDDDDYDIEEDESTVSEEDSESSYDDEDDVWDKLQGFVDVRQEEIGNNTEFGEVETLFPESDWVHVTSDDESSDFFGNFCVI